MPALARESPRPRANSGSGFITIPGPPPNGTSSTIGADRRELAQVVHRDVDQPACDARADDPFRERRLEPSAERS